MSLADSGDRRQPPVGPGTSASGGVKTRSVYLPSTAEYRMMKSKKKIQKSNSYVFCLAGIELAGSEVSTGQDRTSSP